MQPHPSVAPASAKADVTAAPTGGVSRGVVVGLVPPALWLAVVGLTVLAAIVVQQITIGQDFGTQQTIAVSVVGVGLAIAFVVYAIGCVRALRRADAWQRAGEGALAAGALWGLGFGALIVVVPLILGALIPQHPAPLLP